jgi:D-alanyl-D-alanine carboxypeptidase
MNLTSITIRIAFVILACLPLQSCLITDHVQPGNKVQAQLQQLTDSLYQHLNAKWGIDKGGIFLRVTTPTGSNLVSSNIEPGVQDDSHFRIASITKTFTAAAIMRLHQEGKLSIYDFIPAYLPNTPAYNIPYKNQIKIRQLLQHRGGVFDLTNQNIPNTVNQPYAGKRYSDYVRGDLNQDTHTFTFDELIGVVAQNGLTNFAPGSRFQYSNTGYNLLAKIIEQASGMTYSDYITKTFLEPLHLTHTYSVWEGTDTRMKAPFVESFLYVPGMKAINTSEDNMSISVSEGNIVSTPADISKWMELLLTGQAGVSAANVALMKEMQVADVGHGVYGLGLTDNEGLGFGHNGAHLSYLSTLRYNPATRTTVLIVATFFKTGSSPEESNADFTHLAFSLQKTALRAVQMANR